VFDQTGSTGTGGSGGGAVGSLNGNQGQGDVGAIGGNLTIGNGVTVASLQWTITSTTAGGPTYTGNIQITNDAGISATAVQFVAGGIQAGTYTVTISGSDSNGDPCTGTSGVVTVTAGTTTEIALLVTCTAPTDAALAADVTTGSIGVEAGVTLVGQSPYQCPGISSFSISPASILPPQTAALASVSTSFSGGTETFLWTSSNTGATITNATSANATFACGSATGNVTVTLTVNLDGVSASGGDAGLVCPGTAAYFEVLSATVNCEVGGQLQCFAPTPNECVSDAGADAGAFCTNFNTDNNNCGSCGHVCPAATPTCSGGTCTAPLATACTSAPCAAGTVECQGNTNGACTATEAIFVNQDISVNKITAASATPAIADIAAGCYTCLLGAGCLDDNEFGDTGHECGIGPGGTTSDLPATFTNGSGTSVPPTSTCLATAQCVINQGCGTAANGGLTNCYCGSEGGGPSACSTATAVNGACETQELAGFSHSDNSDIVNKDFTNTLEPSGMANEIFSCGKTTCSQCLN